MMKTLLLTLALAAAFPFAARAQAPDAAPGKQATPEEELKALDLSWHAAVAARDFESLGRLLADDYRLDLDARRMLTKAQQVEAVREQTAPFDFGKFKLDEVGVTADGERATVSGILITRPPGGDKKARLRYFYTHSFVRREDRWQIVSSRLVSLPAAGR
jgi:ketosteroid isomerase-like protein